MARTQNPATEMLAVIEDLSPHVLGRLALDIAVFHSRLAYGGRRKTARAAREAAAAR